MPRVPTLDPRVQVRQTNPAAPVASPAPPPEAFGVGVQQATQQLGGAVENLGTTLGKHVIEMERRASQKNSLEIQNGFYDELDKILNNPETDENGVPKGYLNRKMNQATGAAVSFDQEAQSIYKKYKEMPTSPELRNQMDETLRSTLGSSRERVIRHEAGERDAAAKVATETFIIKSTEQAQHAPDPIDLSNMIDATKGNYAAMLGRSGFSQDDIAVRGRQLAGLMTDASVKNLLETNPMKAKLMLETMEKKHGPFPNYEQMAKAVEGKIIYEQQAAVWDRVKGFTRSDGTANVPAMQAYINKLPITAEKKQQFNTYVNAKASVADANLREAITANDRAYVNEIIDLHGKGADVDEAFALATQRGRDDKDITEKMEQARDLFTGKLGAYDQWVNASGEATQEADKYAKAIFDSTYPKKRAVKLKGSPEKLDAGDAAYREFKLQAINKTPEQMKQLANDMVKNIEITTEHFWQNDDFPAWQVSAENRLALQEAEAKLQNDFGVDRVARAKTRLRREGIDVNPFNILKLLEKTTKKESQ